jgi:hypothetical protein
MPCSLAMLRSFAVVPGSVCIENRMVYGIRNARIDRLYQTAPWAFRTSHYVPDLLLFPGIYLKS